MASRDREADANDCKAKGNEFLKAKDFDKAIEWYSEGLKLHETHVLYSNRSAAYLSKGFGESALKDAEKCIGLNPQFAKGYSRKGAALHALHKYPEALAAYQEGLSVDPNNAGIKDGIAAVEAAIAGPPPGAGGPGGPGGPGGLGNLFGPDFMDKVKAHPKLSKYLDDPTFSQMLTMIQANPQMLQIAAQDPRIQEVFSEILGIRFQTGPEKTSEELAAERKAEEKRKADAEKAAKEAEERAAAEAERIKRENETPEEKAKREKQEAAVAAKDEGNGFYKKREFEKALECYDKAIELDPENMVFHLNVGSVKLEQGDLDACIKSCDKAIEVGRAVYADFSQIAKAYERKGNAYFKNKMYEKAIEEYGKAQLENSTPAVANKLKKAELTLKKDKANAYLDKDKAAAAKEVGNEKFKANDYPGAIEAYSEAIKRDPTSAVYYGNRASARLKMMDFSGAMSDCKDALRIDPKYVKIYTKMGSIHFFLKEYHKCLRVYKVALELEPGNAEATAGLQKTQYAVQTSSGEADKQRGARAMEDPEVRNIMQDPIMRQVLEDMSTNPASAREHMQNPEIAANIEFLIAAGVLQTK